ncbi:hypothetical protein KS44_00450 [Pectobacterium brasiliense]|nr:hypothetical protein KS44_00450 [Pectobacterium brasiliense]
MKMDFWVKKKSNYFSDYHTSNINPKPIKRHIKSRLAWEMIRKGKRKDRQGMTDLLDDARRSVGKDYSAQPPA